MMTPEREAAIRAWPRSSYRDRVDVRDLLAELDKERARAERAEAALREARSVCDAVLACETYHKRYRKPAPAEKE